jgi:diaminohydroxyphosphoribosylaminopyrimidine deaminase / 5-amino-6-(5-phosphoribosylamino)uracil reductase
MTESLVHCGQGLIFRHGPVGRCEREQQGAMELAQISTITDAGLAVAMREALAAARHFEGATAPNPPVGCVLLDAVGNVLAAAAHQGVGTPHAEALAIDEARSNGKLAGIHTVVVTLEPCNHHGRTPPCTDAILATPARRVVFGISDPNPHVTGGGAKRLREAGLSVETFSGGATQLQRLIAPFRKRVSQGLPFVTVKQAINRNGSMIPPTGHKTFTSQGSLLIAHALRRRADAIVTGSGTVLADAPLFTVRLLPDHQGKRRPLLIFDRRKRVPASYLEAAAQRGFDVTIVSDLELVLRDAAAAGINEILVEAGPQLTAHVLRSPFWDEHVRITQTEGEDKVEILTHGGGDVLRHH